MTENQAIFIAIITSLACLLCFFLGYFIGKRSNDSEE